MNHQPYFDPHGTTILGVRRNGAIALGDYEVAQDAEDKAKVDIETMAEHLLAMQEGERETPPILEAAFVRAPLARRGWELMTPTQRRGHLWGIFYYRSPEARQRRTDKAVEDAIRVAKSKEKL